MIDVPGQFYACSSGGFYGEFTKGVFKIGKLNESVGFVGCFLMQEQPEPVGTEVFLVFIVCKDAASVAGCPKCCGIVRLFGYGVVIIIIVIFVGDWENESGRREV